MITIVYKSEAALDHGKEPSRTKLSGVPQRVNRHFSVVAGNILTSYQLLVKSLAR